MISIKSIISFDIDDIILKIIKETGNRIEEKKIIHKINGVYKEWCVKESIERLIKNSYLERNEKGIRLIK